MEQADLMQRLHEQLDLLDHELSSIEKTEFVAFDIAVRIRVLIHDTRHSISLLTQLDSKNIEYYDTSTTPGSISHWSGNTAIKGWDMDALPHIGIVGKNVDIIDDDNFSITYFPIYQKWESKGSKVNFDTWWNRVIFDNRNGFILRRSDLILSVAHKAGGAHIDEPSEEYKSFSHKDVMKFSLNDTIKGTNNIPVYSAVAQIGWELYHSIKDELNL